MADCGTCSYFVELWTVIISSRFHSMLTTVTLLHYLS